MEAKQPGIVEALKEKHKKRLARSQQELEQRRAKPRTCSDSYISDVRLFSKWAYRVGKGWYGFSLGNVPRVWTDVLDEFLSWLEIESPDFEIHQVKIKGRGLKIYLGTNTELLIPNETIRSEVSKLENLLSNPPLPRTPGSASRNRRQKRRRNS